MKTRTVFFIITVLAGPIVGVILYQAYLDKKLPPKGQLTLDQILSIRELHLVRHTYNDLFFIHRRNKSAKPVRAIAQVPVTVTAYLNLKDICIEKSGDTIRRVVLPAAKMGDPVYDVSQMQVTRLRAFHLHAGSDLYPDIASYLQEIIHTRMDSVRNVAIRNHIQEQAEAEAKEYVETLLKAIGRTDIEVTFGDPEKDKRLIDWDRD
jgi:hypothetical protein